MGFTAQVVHTKEIPEVVYRCVRNFHCSTTQEEVRPRFVLTSDGCCVTPFCSHSFVAEISICGPVIWNFSEFIFIAFLFLCLFFPFPFPLSLSLLFLFLFFSVVCL